MRPLAAIVLAAVLTLPTAAAAQSKFKRTADGHPDLSGVWCRPGCGLELLTDGSKTTPETAVPASSTSERPSYLPSALEWAQKNAPTDPVLVNCAVPTIPGITVSPFPFEIVSTRSKLYMLYESHHMFRIIPVGKRFEDTDPSYMGDAVATWDGETLVIDSVNFNDRSGMGSGETQHVVERFSPRPDGLLNYTATVSNPKTLARPYTIRLRLERRPASDRVREYECTENNTDAPHLVGPPRAPR